VTELFIGLLGSLLATNPVLAASNVVAKTTGISVPVVDPNDPVERAFQKILEDDDAAQTEVDQWIREEQAFQEQGAAKPAGTLNARIEQRFEGVVRAYDDFLLRHPNHARARLAYGSFLNDTGEDYEAMRQWEKAREADPRNPAAWNNLADYYSHRGPVRKAFEYLEKAIELNPKEPVYYHNLGTVVFLFRKDAKEHYGTEDEQAIFRKALELYRQGLKLNPQNLPLATDLAQVYYYLKPAATPDPRPEPEAKQRLIDEALAAWDVAWQAAHTEVEKQGVLVHKARVCLSSGRFAQARTHLGAVTDPALEGLKRRLLRNLEQKEQAGAGAAGPDPPAATDP
jgi:tetratricopeptide (TPR) repeat protein